MGAQGTTTIDFGAYPGSSDATATVTGQASILSGSLCEAWLWPIDSVDHLADEHMVETIKVYAHNVIAGTGFTIRAFNTSQLNEPIEPNPGANTLHQVSATTINNKNAQPAYKAYGGGIGTRIYGVWNVAWVWN